MPLTFEWDLHKARTNLVKHGIAFEEAATIFGDPSSLTILDPEHSLAEERYVTIGRAFAGKLLVVVHTDRGDNTRIISARVASRRERKFYEKNT
jgi:uncharacterized DUF497 family protein